MRHHGLPSHVIELVKALSRGLCSCTYPMALGGWSYDQETGGSKTHYDPGPKQECLRCQARACLESDGIEYEKVDHVPPVAQF